MLLFLLCLLNIKITFGMKDGFYWRLSVGGIALNGLLSPKDKPRAHSEKKKKKKKSETTAQESEETEKKNKPGELLPLVLGLLETAVKTLPSSFRINLRHLHVSVGGSQAADIALNHGRICALIHGVLALTDGYKGLFYGFRANRRKISVKADFLSKKTQVDFKASISVFVWQLLYVAVRMGLVYILHIMKETENQQDCGSDGTTQNKE